VGHAQSRMARNVAPPTEEQRIRDAILRRARPPRLPVRHLPPLRPLQDGFDTEAPIREPRVGPVVGNSLAGRVICVDAGHGGRSTGAVGTQYLEKDLCLKICLELQRELEAQGARVVMTRTDDSFSSPEERCALANAANAEIFISIHLNASKKRNSASGTETYWFTPHSFPLAQALHARMQETVGKADRGVKNYSWIVCHATTMPSVLLEVAFISNKNDERLLASRQFQQNLAAALAEGVIDYFASR
jgi:N-acetylmuramoyl-L-alanine amidase